VRSSRGHRGHAPACSRPFVKDREVVDIDRVATGEVWFGQRALDVKLVDALQTSDGYIQERLDSHGVFEMRYMQRKNWQQKLGLAAEGALERSFSSSGRRRRSARRKSLPLGRASALSASQAWCWLRNTCPGEVVEEVDCASGHPSPAPSPR
jgi:hypothetical protein